MPKILAFAGSSRQASFNKRLIRIAAAGARDAGGDVTLIDLADYPMPIYNGDLEAAEGIPEKGREFKQLLMQHDGILISSPEYNGALSPLLVNVLDWASRSEGSGEIPLIAYKNKVAAIMSASPGSLGGLRGLVHVRMLLTNLGVLVLPRQQAVKQAAQAFDEDGHLKDEKMQGRIRQLGADLVETLRRLVGDDSR